MQKQTKVLALLLIAGLIGGVLSAVPGGRRALAADLSRGDSAGFPQSGGTAAPGVPGFITSTPAADGSIRHIVKSGEFLVTIAQAYGISLDELLKLSAQEDRIYRLRCVEGWSMVIPWVGYSLVELIKRVEPLGGAKYVEFVTLADKVTMPGVNSRVLEWPYVEGLRLDEAMHPLTHEPKGWYQQSGPDLFNSTIDSTI